TLITRRSRCCRTRTSPSKACTAAWSGPTADGAAPRHTASHGGLARRGVFLRQAGLRGDQPVPRQRLVSYPWPVVAVLATTPLQNPPDITDTRGYPDGREQEARPCSCP